jgi:putative ABC transport system permease protein
MGLLRRFLNTIARSESDRELEEEIRGHIDERTAELTRGGLSGEEARRRALERFGNQTLAVQRTREAETLQWLEVTARDVRTGTRRLVKNPGFAMVALTILAIGVGANTAIFSVLHGVLLRPLPYPEPERLVAIGRGVVGDTQNRAVSLGRVEWLQQTATSFEAVGAFFAGTEDVTLSGRAEPEVLKAARVSANFLDVLAVRPQLGRGFQPADDASGSAPVAMISARLWRRLLAGDPDAVGRSAVINSTPFTIVGVLPDHVRFPFAAVDVWVPRPAAMASLPPRFQTCCAPLRVVARLKPGVTMERAEAELRVLSDRWAAAHPNTPILQDEGAVHAAFLREDLTARSGTLLWVLVAAAGTVLMIACANIALLLLARAASRTRELAVRAAIGATRQQLFREFLTESLVLAIAGGAIGVAVAYALVQTVRQSTVVDLPRVHEISVDGTVLTFSVALSLIAGLLFGTAPSLHMLRRNLADTLRQTDTTDGPTTSRATAKRLSARAALVVTQIALSTVLLIGAGLLVKTLTRLASIDPGFRPEGLLTMRIPLPVTTYDTPAKRALFFEELTTRVSAIPDVRSAAVMRSLPTTPGVLNTNLQIDENKIPEPGHSGIRLQTISPGYFQTLGVRVRRGRDLTAFDDHSDARVAIVNESFARRFWPTYPDGPDPVGKRITVPFVTTSALEIVGVVASVREQGVTSDAIPQVYVPNSLYPPQTAYLAVRTVADADALVRGIRSAVRSLDPDQSVSDIRMMDDILQSAEGQRHLATRVLGLFAGTALMLALVGIYGIVAYSVAQRTHEIGLRRALGSETKDVLRLILGQALRLALIGVLCGLPAAHLLTRMMQTLLFNVSSTDVYVYTVVALLFVMVASLSALIPAWRAVRISPMAALRV